MSEATRRKVALTALSLALLLGISLRFGLVIGEDFPLNDGALFYLMTQELRTSGYSLPSFTSYNASAIPFAYPPLAFYAAGLVSDMGRVPLLDVVRLMPAVLSSLTLGAFYLLSSALLGSRLQAAIATLAFALLPRTFLWFVMGGGLTRAPGLLFALLTLHQVYLLYTRRDRRFAASAALLGAATVLAHPENAWFTVYSSALLFLGYGRSRKALLDSLLVVLGVALLTSPWWATILGRHGLAPFTAVAGSGGYEAFFSWQPIKTFTFTDERHVAILAALGLLGIFVSIADRRFFLPIWLLAVLSINPRNGATTATVPLAMLIGVAIDRLLIEGLLRPRTANVGSDDVPGRTRPHTGAWRAAVLGLLLVFLTAYAFLSARASASGVEGLRVLSPSARRAMEWVSRSTDAQSRFIVVDGSAPWFGLDLHSEWFPALAQRVSVGTVQGYEWLPDHEFYRRIGRSWTLAQCRTSDVHCIEEWSASNGMQFSHIFIAHQNCCERLRSSLSRSPAYTIVYQEADLMIVQRR
jgi:hypothetical protein